jgi:PAS domain S-box-containing protein
VTDLRRAQEERDRERQFLDRVIENVPSSIVVKDYAERRFVLANRSAEKLYQLTAAAALGKTAYDLFDRATADAIHDRDEQSLRAGGELFLHEDAVTLPDGHTRYLTSKRTCIRDTEGKPQYLLNVIEDVTERRHVQQQLQQAQRMEAVGQLTGGLAHDFNNLLHIIIGNLDLLALDVQGNPEAAEKVEAILKSSLRGAELTAQLLAFSRRQSLAPRPLQLNDVLQSLIKLLKRTLGEGIEIELKLDAGLPIITADEAQLEAALVNIAINARDAMGESGKLIIETRTVTLDRDYCAKHAEVSPGAFVLIEITDTGTGMPPEVLSHIFEPFYTTKDPGRGTGLGLSMVFGFVRQSGGHIAAESKVGVGTTFRLYLPCTAGEFDQVTLVPAAPENTSAGARGETILVVEDNPTIRTLVGAQLTQLQYRVVQAEDAAAALERLAQGGVDLLFTDIVMPGTMNGKQLATAAQRRCPELKVLFTSGFPGSGSGGDGIELDSSDLLLKKPYRETELAKAVRHVLDQSAARPLPSALPEYTP